MILLRRKSFESARPIFSALASFALVVGCGVAFADSASAAVTVTRVLVEANFTTASISGSTITNDAADKTADLTVSGSPTGIGTSSGLTFPNTTTGNTNNFITGNLGNTSLMSEIVVEFVGKFPDTGCTAQPNGSMVFGLGSASSFIPYNIYRHSNFLGFNTFNSDIYGIVLPDTSSFHSYKFVMVPGPAAQNTQEIWVDGVKQSLSQLTTSVATSPCSGIVGSESISNRVFKGGSSSYTDGSFMLMSHPLAANNWGTTGSLKSIKITTTNTYVEPSAPGIGAVTAGDGQVSIAFTAPSSDGGRTITDYKYSTDNGSTWVSASSTSSPIVITGLRNGTTYNVKLLAVNSVGDGTASAAVAATPVGVNAGPTAPHLDAVTAGNGQLAIFFAPPADDGGSPITDYEYSTDNGVTWTSAASTVSPIVISGLTNGSSYSVQLRAVTADSVGEASTTISGMPLEAAGNPVTKLAVTGTDVQAVALGSVAAIVFGMVFMAVSRRKRPI